MPLHPCGSCPYRTDVPSGVWAEEEYDKLPQYDADKTWEQPMAAFFCHQQTGALCAGWVGCHDMENSLALRFAVAAGTITEGEYLEAIDYKCSIPLWSSGQEARDHGVAKIEDPDEDAVKVVSKLQKKLERSDE